jgi:glycosyltransferase involved in cell wall biosynthesis
MRDPIMPRVTLCVPTFRRPEGLRRLLAHIARLSYEGPLAVLVIENDADRRAGADVVAQMAGGFTFALDCVIEPQRGQTYAYNRGFATACRAPEPPDFVAVLDDDEYPHPRWLTAMVNAAQKFAADIVGGPVFPVFDDPDHWLARSGFYEPRRYATGRVDMIYGAGSMLIRRSVLAHYLDEPFRHAYAFTGGSDYEFFTRCRRDGRSFAWADNAHVFETTPRSRTSVAWILRRNFRKGTEGTRIDRTFARDARNALLRWYKGLGLLAYGIITLPVAAFGGRRALMDSLNTAARGAGRIAAEFNILYEEYR